MQREVLEKYPSAGLRVYAVWLPMLPADARTRWPDDILSDDRVTHLWDGERKASRWFAESLGFPVQFAWDAFYLYGPESLWGRTPAQPASSGCPIVRRGGELASSVRTLLGGEGS